MVFLLLDCVTPGPCLSFAAAKLSSRAFESGVFLQILLEAFAQFHQLGRDNCKAVRVPLAFAIPVFLMVILRRVPFAALDGGDGLLPLVFVVPTRNGGPGFFFLPFEREDRTAILGADIVALPVQLGRIMRTQKDVVKLGQRDLLVVECDPHAFGMAGIARADLLVGRVRLVPADIAALYFADADHVFHHRFGAPEAPAGNDRLLFCHVIKLLVGYQDRNPSRACHLAVARAGHHRSIRGRDQMRYLLAATALAFGVPAVADDQKLPDPAAFAATHAEAISGAINHPSRAEDRARDQYRHPSETLAFFRVAPDMKVGEYAPGGGWYTRVLGHYLGGEGQLVGLYYDPTSGPFDAEAQQRIRAGAAGFPAEAAEFTGLPAEHFSAMTLDAVPEGEAGTFDRILVIRMLHNMMRWNNADSEIKTMRGLLKPGGMLGIVQHRAPEGASADYANGSKGYLRQDDVVGFVEALGFEFVGSSEVNANPRDPANWEDGVWMMPPSLGGDDAMDAQTRDLGESDRMTLLFRKRD